MKFELLLLITSLASLPLFGQTSAESRRKLAIVLASDNNPGNNLLDFYRSVYRLVDSGNVWTPVPLSELRRAGTNARAEAGIPSFDGKEFRKTLPRKGKSSQTRFDPLQSMLDTLVVSSALVVSCQSKNQLLSSCSLYLYDRSSAKVHAMARKTFKPGVSDATAWAPPLLQTLQDGLQAAQRSKDQAVIEELIARQEEDGNDEELSGFIGAIGLGERQMLANSPQQSLVMLGLQLGIVQDGLRTYLEYARAQRQATAQNLGSERQSIAIGAGFQVRALERLLWNLDIGAGQLIDSYQALNGTKWQSKGLDLMLRVSVGSEFSEHFQFDLGPSLRFYYEQEAKDSPELAGAKLRTGPFEGVIVRLSFAY